MTGAHCPACDAGCCGVHAPADCSTVEDYLHDAERRDPLEPSEEAAFRRGQRSVWDYLESAGVPPIREAALTEAHAAFYRARTGTQTQDFGAQERQDKLALGEAIRVYLSAIDRRGTGAEPYRCVNCGDSPQEGNCCANPNIQTGAEPTAGEEVARRRLWEAIQALRGRGVVGRAEIDLVDQRINEFAGALRAGGPPTEDEVKKLLRVLEAVLGERDRMREALQEIVSISDGASSTSVGDRLSAWHAGEMAIVARRVLSGGSPPAPHQETEK